MPRDQYAEYLALTHNLRAHTDQFLALLMFAKYSVGAQRAAPALARHLLCPKTTLYSAGINKRSGARSPQ